MPSTLKATDESHYTPLGICPGALCERPCLSSKDCPQGAENRIKLIHISVCLDPLETLRDTLATKKTGFPVYSLIISLLLFGKSALIPRFL
jgi:hypothetical protein